MERFARCLSSKIPAWRSYCTSAPAEAAPVRQNLRKHRKCNPQGLYPCAVRKFVAQPERINSATGF